MPLIFQLRWEDNYIIVGGHCSDMGTWETSQNSQKYSHLFIIVWDNTFDCKEKGHCLPCCMPFIFTNLIIFAGDKLHLWVDPCEADLYKAHLFVERGKSIQ